MKYPDARPRPQGDRKRSCPFCKADGPEIEIVEVAGAGKRLGWSCLCPSCQARGPVMPTDVEARTEWAMAIRDNDSQLEILAKSGPLV